MMEITCGLLKIVEKNRMMKIYLKEEDLFATPLSLFDIRTHTGMIISSSEFTTESFHTDTAGDIRVDTCFYRYQNYHITMRWASEKERIRLSYFGLAEWPENVPQPVQMRFPWLSADIKNAVIRFPGHCQSKADGSTALQQKGMVHPPICVEMPDETGYSVWFPLEAANMGWTSSRNVELMEYTAPADAVNRWIHPRVTGNENLLAEMEIWPLQYGWRQCFERMKTNVRACFDTAQYRDSALSWVENCCLTHFAYAFGKEFYDYEKDCPNPLQLIHDSQAFGGYDMVILWHEYPRLGVDERNQWDLYEDYPGGLEELQRIVNLFHQHHIRVIIPYKPWDRACNDTDADALNKIAALIRSLDVDGLFFDTMNTVPPGFREAIDKVKPGVLFMVESEPDTLLSLEQITCSWNQYHSDPSMPEANLIRFLFPEHIRFAIARWHTGIQKDIAIERAVFNAEGMVIWQDVFGCWLPYTKEQKKKIREWKTLYVRLRPIFSSQKVVPLLTSCCPKLFANGFFLDTKAVLTLYADQKEDITGKLISAYGYTAAQVLRGNVNIVIRDNYLFGTIQGRETCVVLLEKALNRNDL